MKLTRHDPQKEAELDMTPMIDIVFQLIIFFMLITDMTQKDLEELVLPVAQTATPDEPDPKVKRPVINILSDGRIFVKGDLYYDPAQDDGYAKLKEYLANMARIMKKEPVEEGSSRMVPADPLLIRADQSTPFNHIQQVMQLCGLLDIQIWKIQLAAAEDSAETPEKEGAKP